jgi:hypothetical protein
MVKIVDSIALDAPASDPNIDETQTFNMDGTLTTSGSHAIDVNVHWEWDQGLGDSDANYADIPTSAAALTTGGTNPQNNFSNANLTAHTITGNTAGSYFVRIRTVDNNDSSAKDVSGTQAVTVNAVASGFGAALSDHRNQTILRY